MITKDESESVLRSLDSFYSDLNYEAVLVTGRWSEASSAGQLDVADKLNRQWRVLLDAQGDLYNAQVLISKAVAVYVDHISGPKQYGTE